MCRLREKQSILTDEINQMLTTGYAGCDYECYRLTAKQDVAALQRA